MDTNTLINNHNIFSEQTNNNNHFFRFTQTILYKHQENEQIEIGK